MIQGGQTAVIAGTLVLLSALPFAIRHSGLRLNDSASIPLGFYRTVPQARYAAICLPENIASTARNAGLALLSGECPDGREPILKSVYRATPAAPIAFTPTGFIIGNRLLPNTVAKPRSRAGVPLDHEPYGTYTAGLWAISDYNPDSFDSRYFGPVSDASVRYYAVPFFLF